LISVGPPRGLFCHNANAFGAPPTLRRFRTRPALEFIQAITEEHCDAGATDPRGAMVNDRGPQFVMHLKQRRMQRRGCERAFICSGQALSTMIVVPQIGLPLLFM
jgi:hypothetical protein